MLIIVPDPVIGARVAQLLREHRQPIAACIVDVHGQVVQPMQDPMFPWSGWRDRGGNGPPGLPTTFRLGVPQDIKAELEKEGGPWEAVNGVDRWRLFYESVAPMPGLPVKNLAETSELPEPRVERYVGAMKRAGLVTIRDGGAVVPDAKGRDVIAAVEGVKKKVVYSKLGVYTDETSPHCSDQQPHTIGVSISIVAAPAQWDPGFSLPGCDHEAARKISIRDAGRRPGAAFRPCGRSGV